MELQESCICYACLLARCLVVKLAAFYTGGALGRHRDYWHFGGSVVAGHSSGPWAARRSQCKNNLKNIGLACHNFHDTYKFFPTGGATWGVLLQSYVDPPPPEPGGKLVGPEKVGLGWGFQLLPYLEEGEVHGITTMSQVQDAVIPLMCALPGGALLASSTATDLPC